MLRILKFFAVMLLLVSPANAQHAWHEQQIASLQVSFPQLPQMKVSSEPSPVGPITSQLYQYRGEGFSLLANSSRLPAVVLVFRSEDELYAAAAEALLQDSKAEKVSYQAVQVMGKSGAELTFRLPSGELGKARFVLVQTTLLVTQATWTGAAPAAVDRFFGSLALRK